PTEIELDESAQHAMSVFRREITRAGHALRMSGAVDRDGHLTSFGKELERFSGLGSAARAIAVMFADQLACAPEVVTALVLLEDTRILGPRGLLRYSPWWPV